MTLQLNLTAIIFYALKYILQFSLSSVYMAESYNDFLHSIGLQVYISSMI